MGISLDRIDPDINRAADKNHQKDYVPMAANLVAAHEIEAEFGNSNC